MGEGLQTFFSTIADFPVGGGGGGGQQWGDVCNITPGAQQEKD